MSVKLTFASPADGGRISRSRSFAGFSSTQSRMLAKSLGKASTRSKMSVKSAKMYSSLQKGAVLCDPKPQQVKKIFEALKKGLNEYLEMHQTELDYLSECHRDRRRNSRLGFYYDLDKQIRSVERYIRKLEFQISKVEELYEAYSIQCRLRDGASNMKHAFSLSPATKASRESLVELYKNLQECTEDMCLIEGTLEVHLGEFHLKMKGLVGYARLCPGDQYEVFIRLGRQKWKIKGKILTDDSQTWDEEEKVFIPSLHENFEIKVTELRGLSTILVGTVTCDSIDFFTTRPQTIIVDITELGTIKLQLEVLWNLQPQCYLKFSTHVQTYLASELITNVAMCCHLLRHVNLRVELSMKSVLQQGKKHANIREETQDSCILSYLDDCDFNMRLRSVSHSLTETTEGSSFSSEDQKVTESRNMTPPSNQRKLPLAILQNNCAEGEERDISICQPPGHRTLDILQETPYAETSLSIPSCRLEEDKNGGKSITRDWHYPSEQERKILSVEQRDWNDNDDAKPTGKTKSIQKILQEVLNLLKSQGPSPIPLEELEYQVFCIQDKLKPKKYHPKHSSMESLMVETVLESFDFLNADCSADELSSFGSVRTCSTSIYNDATLSSLCCDAHMEKELTTGCDDLDRLLEIHLQLCWVLLQKLIKPNLAPILQENLLKEVSQQKHVLEIISALATPVPRKITSVEEIIQKAKKQKHCLKIWSECTEQGSILFCPVERFWTPLKYILMFKTKEKYRHHLEKDLLLTCIISFLHALPFYTDLLSNNDAKLQQAACLALKNLRGIESLEQIATLCQSEAEEVRTTARETTLSFGEKGRLAFEKMDKICCELREAMYQEAEIEITIF
ncbi:PREDICTED: protein FAM65C [Thamnophis sirtalis]|uniref:Protein FAM65C n=1 Tax=Thamnophis sirtalis TaxID=35019 RepID=A0A6I9XN84_9SAUR|nr:PREDICTED: protein FAM65C [Thamnophis sirtalis]